MTARFTCAVCKTQAPIEARGRRNYQDTPNGGQICFGCIDTKDRVDMAEKGRIHLAVETNDKGQRWAVNRSGGIRYPLAEGEMLQFTDENRRIWRGRTYDDGSTLWQATKRLAPAPAPASPDAPKATAGTRPAAKPAKAKAKAKKRKAVAKA